MDKHARDMRILMLGASGKLGRALRAVWDAPDEIIPVFRHDAPPGAVTWQPGEALDALGTVDVILALWGVTRGTPEALAANVTLARDAAVLAEALGARQVLHCSSVAVYAPGRGDLAETDPLGPATAYGQAKLQMEEAVQRSFGQAKHVLMRIGNVAGADSLFANMQPGGRMRLDRFEDGAAPERSYIAPDMLARVMRALMSAEVPGGVVNVAAPGAVSMAALAKAAGCDVTWRDAPRTALRRVVMDTGRLSRICALPEAQPDALIDSARRAGIWP